MFENDSNKEVTFVTGFVNNPGKNKYLLLNQLDVIINDIKKEGLWNIK